MAMTGRHSVFKIPSAKWFRPPEVREATNLDTTPRHARLTGVILYLADRKITCYDLKEITL